MDIKEIIKWFIPCFHILLNNLSKMDARAVMFCLFLLFNLSPSFGATVNSVDNVQDASLNSFDNAKNLDLEPEVVKLNQSDVEVKSFDMDVAKSFEDLPVGRTFGRPFKKMMAALLPLVFQIGAASTWAVIAAVVGVKTLLVTLLILKLLLVAGAAKFGALFASKGHHHESHDHGWQPPHKEIHLHIHGGHGSAPHEESLTPWSRNEVEPDKSYYNMILNPQSYAVAPGPQTIRTPYGNYMKVE